MSGRFVVVAFPVFCHYMVHIEIADDLRKAMAKYPATQNVPLTDTTEGITVHKKDDSFTFIFLKTATTNAGVLAHECYHAVRRMFDYMGCDPDNEAIAYHLGYLVNQATPLLYKRKRDRGKIGKLKGRKS